MFWTVEDFQAGLCGVGDLGKPKPPPEPEVSAALTDESLNDLLKRDAIAAYKKQGGVKYLIDNPDMLGKVLAKALLPDRPTEAEDGPPEWPSWLKARRLAYQVADQSQSDVGPGESWSADPKQVRAFLHAYPQILDYADEFLRAQNRARSAEQITPDPEVAAHAAKRLAFSAKPTRELPPPRNSKAH